MRYLLIFMCLCLVGCNWLDSRGRPILQKGESEETQQIKQRNELTTDILVQTEPTDKPGPVTVYDFYDRKVKVPSNAKVTFIVKNDYTSKQTDWYQLLGTFDYTSSRGQWIFIGILCIAGGGVLCYFGMWKVGGGLMLFGVLIIGCALAISKYPGLFIAFLILCILAVVAFVIYSIRNKKLAETNTDYEAVMAEIVSKIEAMKKINPELTKQHITEELKKSDISSKIKKIIGKIKGNENG